MSRVLVGFDETTENFGEDRHIHGDGHGFFERLLHKSPKGTIISHSIEVKRIGWMIFIYF